MTSPSLPRSFLHVPHFLLVALLSGGLMARADPPAPGGGDLGTRLVFEQHPSAVTGRQGASVVLDCEAGGSPTPIIYWLHGGQRIRQGSAVRDGDALADDVITSGVNDVRPRLRLGSTKSRLYLDCLRPDDAGEYQCVASSGITTITTSTMLSIDSTQTSSTCGVRKRIGLNPSAAGARIYMWTSSRLEFEGSDVILYCRADGTPRPIVHWFDRQDQPIKNNPQYQLLASGDLLIKAATWSENMGTYRCTAENLRGSDQVSTFLYPTSP